MRPLTKTTAVVVLSLLLAACGSHRKAARSTDVAELRAVRSEIVAGLASTLGPRPWRTTATGQQSLCSHGRQVYLPTATLETGYPEQQWPRLRAVVRRVAREHGFDRTLLDVARPGLLEIDLVTSGGAELDLETTPHGTRLSLISGCLVSPSSGSRS